MATTPTRDEVMADVMAAIDAFDGATPDGPEGAPARLLLLRSLVALLASRGLVDAAVYAPARTAREWQRLIEAVHAVGSCELCGGFGNVGRGVPSMLGADPVPCPACGGRGR